MMRLPLGSTPAYAPGGASQSSGSVDLSAAPRSVHDVIELEKRERVGMTFSDRLANNITAFAGSMGYVWLHVLWFAVWIAANSPPLSLNFDPFPFGLLTMIVSLEAIFLSTFVLISQNRQAVLSDKRAKLDLQVNAIAEEEITKLMDLVADIHEHLGLSNPEDDDLDKMRAQTRLTELVDVMEQAEQGSGPSRDSGPKSAADTES
jgi:uncharacterized membrane protein